MYKLYINAYGSDPIETESIIAALEENRIVSFIKNDEGSFSIKECCDNYYGGKLTKKQMIALSDEIRRLAES